jgi:hypothetical protein
MNARGVAAPRAGLSREIKPMSIKSSRTENGIDAEPRTRRACEEPMVVVPEGDGTGMFEVWTGTCDDEEQPYIVDLGGAHDRCSCPDMEYNLEDGERCKHSRRCRLEFGLPPFGEVPAIRSEHAAPMDVELARCRRGIDDVDEEPAVEPITVAEAKPARQVATDGGQVVESTPEPEPETGGSDVEDGRPEDCDCGAWNEGLELPCWPCYRDGFGEPGEGSE